MDETSLTFTATGWSTVQTVEVTAAEDADGANDRATLTHTAAGADYGSVSKDLPVTATDDDPVGLALSARTLAVSEGGSETYTVALATQPTGEVTVTVGGTTGNDLSVHKSSLTFTRSDWSTVLTVEVTAWEDHDASDDSPTLMHTAAGADYGSVSGSAGNGDRQRPAGDSADPESAPSDRGRERDLHGGAGNGAQRRGDGGRSDGHRPDRGQDRPNVHGKHRVHRSDGRVPTRLTTR